MSIPPNNLPPGYYSPPPVRPSGGVSGWKIFGFGCLGLLVLAVVGSVLFVRSVQSNLAHPNKNSFVGIGVLLSNADSDALSICQAIKFYHTQHGKYPQALTDLHADSSFNSGVLHNALDPNSDPKHISWQYTPPPEGAAETTPVMTETYDVMPGQHDGSGQIIISLNGKSRHR